YHRFIQALLRGEPVTVFGDGLQVRGNTYIDDCVAATVAAVGAPVGETYNVGGGESASVWDILAELEKLAGRHALGPRAPAPPRPAGTAPRPPPAPPAPGAPGGGGEPPPGPMGGPASGSGKPASWPSRPPARTPPDPSSRAADDHPSTAHRRPPGRGPPAPGG